MDQLRTINNIPTPVKAFGAVLVLTAAGLVYNIYNSNQKVTINCLETSLEYKKDDPKIEEARKKGMEIKNNPNGTSSVAFPESVTKNICGQSDVQGISTSGNSELEKQIRKALGQNATEKEKLNKKVENAGRVISDKDKQIEEKAKAIKELNKQIQSLKPKPDSSPKPTTPPKKK